MLGRRVGRGGLLRTAATTAVVAGTATAVAGGVRSRQNAKAQDAAEAQAYEQQQAQLAAQQAADQQAADQQAMAAAPAENAPSGSDLTGDIQGLATLHAQGALSDAEFAAAKAKLLS
jgi:Short C-terminal domain